VGGQTAQEQAQLLVEISDAYAEAQVASHLPGVEVEGINQIMRIEDFSADLINAGLLPSNLATGSLSLSPDSYAGGGFSTEGIPHTGYAGAIGKGLLKLSANTFNWMSKNKGLVLGGAAVGGGLYITHDYLSQPLQMKQIEVDSAREQLKVYIKSASQEAIDAALSKTAMTYAQAGAMGFGFYAKWLIPIGMAAAGLWFYFSTRDRR
jgi:hypothetical protein